MKFFERMWHVIRQIPFILHYRVNNYIQKCFHLPHLYELWGEVNKEIAEPGFFCEVQTWFYQRNLNWMKNRLDAELNPTQSLMHSLKQHQYIPYADLEIRLQRYMQREFELPAGDAIV